MPVSCSWMQHLHVCLEPQQFKWGHSQAHMKILHLGAADSDQEALAVSSGLWVGASGSGGAGWNRRVLQ